MTKTVGVGREHPILAQKQGQQHQHIMGLYPHLVTWLPARISCEKYPCLTADNLREQVVLKVSHSDHVTVCFIHSKSASV